MFWFLSPRRGTCSNCRNWHDLCEPFICESLECRVIFCSRIKWKPRVVSFRITINSSCLYNQILNASQVRGKQQDNSCSLDLEFAGTVVSSPVSSNFRPGNWVFGGGTGAFVEYIWVKESSLHYIPKYWSTPDAVSLTANAPISDGGLVILGGLKKMRNSANHGAGR